MLKKYSPTYFAHFASQSSVFDSLKNKEDTYKVNHLQTLGIIESIKQVSAETVFFFPSSATIYEKYSNKIVNESLEPKPLSHYAKSKFNVQKYISELNETEELNLNTGILFSHESEFRKNTFFTKMIIEFLVNYKNNKSNPLTIGDISIERDIGYAKDYVDAIYKIMKSNLKEEFIISQNKLTKLSLFIQICLDTLGVEYIVRNRENNIEYVDLENNKTFIFSKKTKYRDYDLRNIQGDNTKILNKLSWSPTTTLVDMIKIMIDHEQRYWHA